MAAPDSEELGDDIAGGVTPAEVQPIFANNDLQKHMYTPNLQYKKGSLKKDVANPDSSGIAYAMVTVPEWRVAGG